MAARRRSVAWKRAMRSAWSESFSGGVVFVAMDSSVWMAVTRASAALISARLRARSRVASKWAWTWGRLAMATSSRTEISSLQATS